MAHRKPCAPGVIAAFGWGCKTARFSVILAFPGTRGQPAKPGHWGDAMSMRKIFWVLTLASTVLGGLYFAWTVIYAVNFTQLTAQTLVSLAIVVIPFVFTRCLEGMRHTDVLRVRIVGNERPGGTQDRGVAAAGYE
jgi:predicted cobalt transporter CbtA